MNDLPLTAPLIAPLTATDAWGDAAPSTVSPSAARVNQPEYTVSELSLALKRAIEDGFGFVRVRGEVSGSKRHCLRALLFRAEGQRGCARRGVLARHRLPPRNRTPRTGWKEIICSGKLTTYAGRSKYQLVVEAHRAGRHRRAAQDARGTQEAAR